MNKPAALTFALSLAAWAMGCSDDTDSNGSTGSGAASSTGGASGTGAGTTTGGGSATGGNGTGGSGTGGANNGGTNNGGANNGGSGGAGGAACVGSTAVMLNEVNYDVPGGDNGKEWIEIYNASANSVDISGWKIEAGGSTYTVRFTFPAATTIDPDEYVVVGGPDVGGANFNSQNALNMPNASSTADGVRLVTDADAIIDTVIYGPAASNTDMLVDDCGVVAASYAIGGPSAQVLARSPNGVDTNDSGVDFISTNTLTMGDVNP